MTAVRLPCVRGHRGETVRAVQEWLCLNGYCVPIDDDFGPATERAVELFQAAYGLENDKVVGQETYAALVAPMTEATRIVRSIEGGSPLGKVVTLYAQRHLDARAREVGGQNKGPWVRLYMGGHEGSAWPWCAGFASYVLKQACKTVGTRLPLAPSYSCDMLAMEAREGGILLAGRDASAETVGVGDLFLVRRTSVDWTHVGVVLRSHTDYIETIEGNTNDEGSREGYEVCRRFRSYGKKDFILIR